MSSGIANIAKIMEKRTNSKELFRMMVTNITIAETPGEIESIVYLIMHSLFGVRREQIMAGKELTYDDTELNEIINRINRNEPVQYILQEAEFYGRLFFVDKHVLIPRPETELLVREVIDYARNLSVPPGILDIGTGSGCIAVTLGCELPDAVVTATDLSDRAIEVAHRNSLTFNTYVEFFVSDILNDELPVANADIIISNPPYIAQNESAAMSPNVLDYEPHLALFVPDQDPLVFYRAIAIKSKNILKQGVVFVEINEKYGNEVRQIFIDNGFQDASVIKDIDGKDRIVKSTL